jgi:DNA-binding transcriptional LysR family regulator
MPFDLELLHTFVVIAECGSFSAAAPRLSRSQSAVSEQIRKLEEACGLPLFSRGKTGAVLTSSGERLLAPARQLLMLSERAFQEMRGQQLAGDLRLAISDYFKPITFAAVLKRLREQYPFLRLHVSVTQSASILSAASGNTFDIGLYMQIRDAANRNTQRSFDEGTIRLRKEVLLWVAHDSFKLENDRPLPLLVLAQTCTLQRLILSTLEKSRVRYEVAHSASGVGGLHLALMGGLGVTCLNESAIPPGVSKFDVKGRLPKMPTVEFCLLPPRRGERALVGEVRQLLARELT